MSDTTTTRFLAKTALTIDNCMKSAMETQQPDELSIDDLKLRAGLFLGQFEPARDGNYTQAMSIVPDKHIRAFAEFIRDLPSPPKREVQQPDRMSVLQTANWSEIDAITWDDKTKDKPIIMQIRDNLREWSDIAKDRLLSIEKFQAELATKRESAPPDELREKVAFYIATGGWDDRKKTIYDIQHGDYAKADAVLEYLAPYLKRESSVQVVDESELERQIQKLVFAGIKTDAGSDNIALSIVDYLKTTDRKLK